VARNRESFGVGDRPGRRGFLGAAIGGCMWCGLSRRSLGQQPMHRQVGGTTPPHWSYDGEAGSGHWGELSADFKSCEFGVQQSPIDLADPVTAQLGGLDIAYHDMKLRIINNGHTIQVNADPGSLCVIGGTKYELLQFHFHHPGEHLLSGKAFDLECHLVHRSAAGDLAVIGVLVKPGAANPALAPVWNAMPNQAGPEKDAGIAVNPTSLLPAERGFFRYMGSLTTPPCSEGITWSVLRTVIEASPDQIRQFAALFANNARPIQVRNRRYLLQTS